MHMNEERERQWYSKDPVIGLMMRDIEARKRFAPKYRAAQNRDDLLLEFAEALTFVSGILTGEVQGPSFMENPNQRLFCECLEILRKGLVKELRKSLPNTDAVKLSEGVVAFACAIFANMNGYSQEQKDLLLQDLHTAYLENQNIQEHSTDPTRLFQLVGNEPTAKAAAPVIIFLSSSPWLFVEPDDFVECWKRLPASDQTFHANEKTPT